MTNYKAAEVNLTSPTNGQVLTYSNGKWVNATPSGGGGGLPDPAMPQLSAPAPVHLGGFQAISWDGKDHSGNPVPEGFERAILKVEQALLTTGALTHYAYNFSTYGTENPFNPTSPPLNLGPNSTFSAASPSLTPLTGETTVFGQFAFLYKNSPNGTGVAKYTSSTSSNGCIVLADNALTSFFFSYDLGSNIYIVEVDPRLSSGYSILDTQPEIAGGHSLSWDGTNVILLNGSGTTVATYQPTVVHTGTNVGVFAVTGASAVLSTLDIAVPGYTFTSGPAKDYSIEADTNPYNVTADGWTLLQGTAKVASGALTSAGTSFTQDCQIVRDLGTYGQKISYTATGAGGFYFAATIANGLIVSGMHLYIYSDGSGAYQAMSIDGSVSQVTNFGNSGTFTGSEAYVMWDGTFLSLLDNSGNILLSSSAHPEVGKGTKFVADLGYSPSTLSIASYNFQTVAMSFQTPVEVGSLVGAGSILADRRGFYTLTAQNVSETLGTSSSRVEISPLASPKVGGLSDVAAASPQDGDVLVYKNKHWVSKNRHEMVSFSVDGCGAYYGTNNTTLQYATTDIDPHFTDDASYGLPNGFVTRYTPHNNQDSILLAPFFFPGCGQTLINGGITVTVVLGTGPDCAKAQVNLVDLATNTYINIGTDTDCYSASKGTTVYSSTYGSASGLPNGPANVAIQVVANGKNSSSSGYNLVVGRITVSSYGGDF